MKGVIQELIKDIKAQGYESICFWLPALNVGGGTNYLCALAKYLVKNSDLKIYYMDYPGGYASKLLKDAPEVKFLSYNENNLKFPLAERCIIITNSTRLIQISDMRPDNKLLFWHWETVPCAWDIVLINNEAKKYLELAKKNNALVYHDWSARNSLSKYKNLNFKNKDYLHLYTEPKNIFSDGKIINKEEINLCFLSRLVLDKTQSLYYLIENYARYHTIKKKRLHIIGDGVCKQQVLKFCEAYNKDIEFIFTDTIQKENLHEYLLNNVDILFAVGMSVLEAAILKIPAVPLLMSTNKIEDNQAYWIYNIKEYALGILDSQKKDFDIKYTNISDIINSVYAINDGKRLQGEKCYQYYLDNHSNYDNIVFKFLTFVKNTNLSFKKLRKCIKYTPYNLVLVEKSKPRKFPIFKKITFLHKTRYYLFGVPFLKKIQYGNNFVYRLFGIKIFKTSPVVPFKFPNAKFVDKK